MKRISTPSLGFPFQAGIVNFSAVNAVFEDRPATDPPQAGMMKGVQFCLRTVRKVDIDLRNQFARTKPTVSEDEADTIPPRLQAFRNVVGAVQYAL